MSSLWRRTPAFEVQPRELTAEILRAARNRPSFGLYLIALGLLPVKWLSPFSHEQAGWTDVFVAAATAVWLLEIVRHRRWRRLRAPHYGLVAYLAAGALSAVFATTSHSTAAENLLIILELVALAILTSDFARDETGRRAIVLVVLFDTLLTAALAVAALALFYAGVSTSLLSAYGDLEPSSLYARVAAGFYSAPLLGSFCIFASAVIAVPGSGLPKRLRAAMQAVLAVLVVLTLSRAILGFAVAWAIRWAAQAPARGAQRAVIAGVVIALAAMGGLTLGRLLPDPSPPAVHYRFLDESSSPRLTSLERSAETLADHPLVGIGPGGLPGEIQGEPGRAHLTPLNVAATMGPLALAGLIFAVGAIWSGRRRPTNVAIWSGLAGLGVDALGQDVEHFRHVWIMLGFADADRREGAADQS